MTRLLNGVSDFQAEKLIFLIELIQVEVSPSIPDEYDEMQDIITTMERNSKIQTDEDGRKLADRARMARSNRNIDLEDFDMEILRQFNLKSVEVVGDGVRLDMKSLLERFYSKIFLFSRVPFVRQLFQVRLCLI